MKCRLAVVGLACLVSAAPALADGEFKGFAKPFSADVRESGDQYKVECAGTRCRVTAPQKKAAGNMIADYRRDVSYVVFDESRQYFENASSRSMEYFDPCAKMKAMQADMKKGGVDPAQFGLTCRKMGSVALKGRPADKYETHMKGEEPGQHLTAYFDPELNVVVKREGQGDEYEVSNIRVGGVSEASLQVPAGYAKMTEEQFLKRTLENNKRK